MDQRSLEASAFANLPNNECAITKRYTDDPVVMHRDLSDWWPPSLHDMRDDRLGNLLIVDGAARRRYYEKLKQTGVVLAYSGGLDSSTVLHWCAHVFGEVTCLIFNYKQRHIVEIESAKSYLNKHFDSKSGVTYKVVDMSPINELAESALTRDIDVPKDRDVNDMVKDIPVTFVPGRNIYFTTALSQIAFAKGWRHIAIGVNVLDYSGYPDCRPEFLQAMQEAIRIGIFNGKDVAVHAPLMQLSKVQIIRLGQWLDVDYGDTHSCYEGVLGGCSHCDSCVLRQQAFKELGLVDPAIERASA